MRFGDDDTYSAADFRPGRHVSIGIVIPCYNVSRYIRSTVDSLLSQDFSNWEAVIVDDGSPDDIRGPIKDILRVENRLRYFRTENSGVASARNFGFRQLSCKADYVLFLDGDDMLQSSALRLLAEELEHHPGAGMVHCEPEFIDEEGRTVNGLAWLPRWTYGPRRLESHERLTPFESIYALNGNCALLRRSVYDQTPGYDEKFGQHFEDTDLFLHMAIRASVRYLPDKLYCYRQRVGQSTANRTSHNFQMEKLYRKWRQMEGLSPVQLATVRRAEAFRTGELAAHLGFLAARRSIKNRRWLAALRFWQGAVRRSLVSRFQVVRA